MLHSILLCSQYALLRIHIWFDPDFNMEKAKKAAFCAIKLSTYPSSKLVIYMMIEDKVQAVTD